jgi:ligand-binding SRPBCC domain-containing protein
MGKFIQTHTINCNTETFWKTFFEKEFNTQLYKGPLGFPDFQVVTQNDDGTTLTRKVAAQPKMEVPGALQKLIGPGFRYTEEGTMKWSEGVWRWKMIPSTLADKLHTSGIVRVEAQGDKVRRISEVTIEAKIFALGGLIESTAEKQMRDGWDKSAVFMNQFIERAGK